MQWIFFSLGLIDRTGHGAFEILEPAMPEKVRLKNHSTSFLRNTTEGTVEIQVKENVRRCSVAIEKLVKTYHE
jgi:hypothetical protein